jgi:hypothetical protein
LPPQDDTALLTVDEQEQLWTYLVKGASPQLACHELGLSVRRFWATFDRDPQFAIAMEDVFRTLSHNVLSKLYLQAIKGDKAAQQIWLRVMPPFTGNPRQTGESPNDLAQLSDAQLLDRATETGVNLPDEIAACLSATGSDPASASLSSGTAPDDECGPDVGPAALAAS